MKSTTLTLALLTATTLTALHASAKDYIVKNGQPMAEIVIPEEPCASVRYAAQELQDYIAKISGATLPIFPPQAMAAERGGHLRQQYPLDMERMPIRIYLGDSWHTDRLGVTDEGLAWGAYRMKSGNGWLALVGNDTDFTPMGIWGRDRGHMNGTAVDEWKAAIGDHNWGNPLGKLWTGHHRGLDLWAFDQKGTLTAVYAFLRSLGVRWYMPGELGELVPTLDTIELPDMDQTVVPDYKIRKFAFSKYFLSRAEDAMLWALRMGANHAYGFGSYHGLGQVTRPEENRKTHPEFYALYNGKRDNESHTANPCLSSKGLFDETVAYCRFVFDMFEVPALSVWPDDGFGVMCQCKKCAGKDTPERGRQGVLSDYVWGFVNRVAKEVYKTHPDKLILCGAYSAYWLPPLKIDKLHPNVAVHIVNARRRYDQPEADLRARRDAVREWARLTDNKVIAFMNHGGGANTPHMFAEDIKAYNGLMLGEDMWGPSQAGALANPGFTHLNYYVCARLWWDADQDIDDLLDEYYKQFYGPAAKQMAAFIDYYEVNQGNMRSINSAAIIRKALDLFAKAEQRVEPDSVYGQRMAMFSKGLAGKRAFYEKIKDGRDNPPIFQAAKLTANIDIDGALTEEFWQELPGSLTQIVDGSEVTYPTRFQIGVKDYNLYVGITCMDEAGNPVNIGPAEPKDDSSMWYGDHVELLLETPAHSYYQIAVSPEAAVCDLDRAAGLVKGFLWSAEADIATQVNEADGYWTIEARIPFTPSLQDPLHEIVGPPPSQDTPWYFNICRQRVRDEGGETSAFSPTGQKTYHHILKFGKLIGE